MNGFSKKDTVAQHYDNNPMFADSLNHLIPNFEYPNWSYRTIGEVLDTVSSHHIDAIIHALERVDLKPEEVFEFNDPYSDAKYSLKSFDKAVAKCEEFGLSSFHAVNAYGVVVPVNKVNGEWERGVSQEVVRDNKAQEAKALTEAFEECIRTEFIGNSNAAALSKDEHSINGLTGIAQNDQAQKNALNRIEARSLAFLDAEAVTKAAAMVGIVGVNARLKASREMKVNVVNPEVAAMWAELDFRDFSQLNFISHRKLDAGLMIAGNMAVNKEYQLYLEQKAPTIVQSIKAIDHENKSKIQEKEMRKMADMLVVSNSEASGMVSLNKIGGSMIAEFGGVPAILSYAKEHPEVPIDVVNELLARDGGIPSLEEAKESFLASLGEYGHMESPEEFDQFCADKNYPYSYKTDTDHAWSLAADTALQNHSFKEAQVCAEQAGYRTCFDKVENATVIGSTVDQTEHHVVFGSGRAAFILNKSDLNEIPPKGERVSIAFSNGLGVVCEKKELGSSLCR